MYVIFPADELIYMTYGAVVPRLQPRPTLDNLQEPLVPFGTRPSSARNLLDESKITQPNKHQQLSYSNINKTRDRSPSAISNKNLPLAQPSPPPINNKIDDIYNNRDRSPSVFLESPSLLNQYHTASTGSNKSVSGKIKTADKQKQKLHLPLGRLGKSQIIESPETSRLREDHQFLVANPTFTRENLRQRNYDAFFESGSPVYSIEKRAQSQTRELSFEKLPPPSPIIDNQQRPNTIGFFHRTKSPAKTATRNSIRAKSADIVIPTVEVNQKETPPKSHRSLFGWKSTFRSAHNSRRGSMATSVGLLKDLCHPNYNEALKTHNGVTFKLVKTVSDFTDALALLYEQHAESLQLLVSSFRKKNGELRKERPACHSSLFQAWETFLQEIEADSQSTSDVANSLSRQVARPLLERSFHRKVQSRKVFTHRESFDTIIAKTEEKLSKCRIDYKQCYIAHRQNPNQISLSQYIDSHNAYVQQLHATNAMLESYHCETLPQLLQELEEIYSDLCNIVSEAVLQGAEVISNKAIEQAKRYDGLTSQCKLVSGQQDLGNLTRVLPVIPNSQKIPRKPFAPPQPPVTEDDEAPEYDNLTPMFKNELVLERGAAIQPRPTIEALKREALDLEVQIRQLQDSIDALARTQSRGLDSQLYNKANELQEDISMKKFDLRAKQIHLAAVKAQKELFLGKSVPTSPRAERKLSASSSSSMKTKWLKAFRSLKPTSASAPPNDKTNQMYHAVSTVLTIRKNGAASAAALAQIRAGDTESHNLQEYTYKKITPCDVCGQVLRGHTRQGLRCRICKTNAHADCAPQLSRCQAKQKLLRRQKSTSEIENRVDVEEEREGPSLLSRHLSREPGDLENIEVDQIYQVLKQAGEISSNKLNTNEKITTIGGGLTTGTTTTAISTNNNGLQEIPVVNIPECPDRTPRRGLLKYGQTNQQRQNAGLTAPPLTDVSSSVSTTTATTAAIDTGTRRRLFAGFRPLSVIGRIRLRSAQHRSISLPEKGIQSSRPFGQPLCLVAEDQLEEISLPIKGARKKR